MDCGENDTNLNYVSYLRKLTSLNPSRLVVEVRGLYIYRLDPSSLTFRVFNYKPIGTRTRNMLKLRWADCVVDDFKVLTVTNWRTVAKVEIETRGFQSLSLPYLLAE
ncbi:hypothetical protein TNCV_4748921 [Trichonephila clavipes]|nr:hypothetical protein TNCV_4748921 [Trichonephila clavipes]